MSADAGQVRAFVSDRIRKLASRNGESLEELDDEFNLMDSGLFDSIAFVQLITDIEEEFDLEFDFGDLDPEEFTKLGGLIRCAVP